MLSPFPPTQCECVYSGAAARSHHFLVLSSRDERASTLPLCCVSKGEGVDTVADLAVSVIAFGEGRFRGRRTAIFQIVDRLSRAIRSCDEQVREMNNREASRSSKFMTESHRYFGHQPWIWRIFPPKGAWVIYKYIWRMNIFGMRRAGNCRSTMMRKIAIHILDAHRKMSQGREALRYSRDLMRKYTFVE